MQDDPIFGRVRRARAKNLVWGRDQVSERCALCVSGWSCTHEPTIGEQYQVRWEIAPKSVTMIVLV